MWQPTMAERKFPYFLMIAMNYCSVTTPRRSSGPRLLDSRYCMCTIRHRVHVITKPVWCSCCARTAVAEYWRHRGWKCVKIRRKINKLKKKKNGCFRLKRTKKNEKKYNKGTQLSGIKIAKTTYHHIFKTLILES